MSTGASCNYSERTKSVSWQKLSPKKETMIVITTPEGTIDIQGLTPEAAQLMVEAICMYFAKGNRITSQEMELVALKVLLEKQY